MQSHFGDVAVVLSCQRGGRLETPNAHRAAYRGAGTARVSWSAAHACALAVVALFCARMEAAEPTAAEATSAPAPAAAPADAAAAAGAGDATPGADAPEGEGIGKTLQERIRAVSRRVFLKRQRFELVPNVGITTNDAFRRSWSGGARASFHFNEEFAVDVGGGFAPIVQPLEDIRVIGTTVNPTSLPGNAVLGTLDGGVTFSPFYGKLALMSEHVIHFDGFLSGGLGAVFDTSAELVHPSLEVGVGTRVFLTRFLTVRADLRNYIYPVTVAGALAFPNVVMLTLGVGIHLPFDFDYSNETIGAKG